MHGRSCLLAQTCGDFTAARGAVQQVSLPRALSGSDLGVLGPRAVGRKSAQVGQCQCRQRGVVELHVACASQIGRESAGVSIITLA